MKNLFWIFAIGIVVAIGFWFSGFGLGGCASTLQSLETTTTATAVSTTTFSTSTITIMTTTTAITTTTLNEPISGSVSWDWSGYSSSDQHGELFIFLWTDEDFGNKDLMSAYKKIDLTAGQTSASFQFDSPGGPLKGVAPSPGKYYIFALLYVGRTVLLFDDLATGDKLGQLSDGKIPISFGGSTHAERIDYTGAAVTGKNLFLNAIWP